MSTDGLHVFTTYKLFIKQIPLTSFTHFRLVSQRSEGEPVLRDNLGVVGEAGHSSGGLGLREDNRGVGVVVDPTPMVGCAERENGTVALGAHSLLNEMSVAVGEESVGVRVWVVVTPEVVANFMPDGVMAESAGLRGH